MGIKIHSSLSWHQNGDDMRAIVRFGVGTKPQLPADSDADQNLLTLCIMLVLQYIYSSNQTNCNAEQNIMLPVCERYPLSVRKM